MTVLKVWFIILSPKWPRIAFRDERCLTLISYLLEQKQVELHPTLLSQPSAPPSAMSTSFDVHFIGGEAE
jgi:hypothetical protein